MEPSFSRVVGLLTVDDEDLGLLSCLVKAD